MHVLMPVIFLQPKIELSGNCLLKLTNFACFALWEVANQNDDAAREGPVNNSFVSMHDHRSLGIFPDFYQRKKEERKPSHGFLSPTSILSLGGCRLIGIGAETSVGEP